MERVYLHINIPNMITVGVMMLVWFMVYGLFIKWRSGSSGAQAAA